MLVERRETGLFERGELWEEGDDREDFKGFCRSVETGRRKDERMSLRMLVTPQKTHPVSNLRNFLCKHKREKNRLALGVR